MKIQTFMMKIVEELGKIQILKLNYFLKFWSENSNNAKYKSFEGFWRKNSNQIKQQFASRGSALGFPTLGFSGIFGIFEIPNPRIFLGKILGFFGIFFYS